MRGRRQILLAVGAVVVILVVTAVLVRRPSAATWKGKTAEEWFRQFRAAAGRGTPVALPGRIPPGVVVGRTANGQPLIVSVPPGAGGAGRAVFSYGPDEMLSDVSAEGLRGLGTNAAIFLDRELRRKDLPFAGSYTRLYAKLPAVLRKVLPSPAEPRALVRRDAAVAVEALGINAWPAVPGLISALTKGSMGDWNYFRVALRRLPFEDETWDPALDVFGRRQDDLNGIELVRSVHSRTRMAAQLVANGLLSTNNYIVEAALDEVGGFGQRAEMVIPALVIVWESRDSMKRQGAFAGFERLGPRAASALPNVLRGLEDKEDEMRYEAARILEAMGTNASPALEALRRATNDSNVMVQRAARRALEGLEGDQ